MKMSEKTDKTCSHQMVFAVFHENPFWLKFWAKNQAPVLSCFRNDFLMCIIRKREKREYGCSRHDDQERHTEIHHREDERITIMIKRWSKDEHEIHSKWVRVEAKSHVEIFHFRTDFKHDITRWDCLLISSRSSEYGNDHPLVAQVTHQEYLEYQEYISQSMKECHMPFANCHLSHEAISIPVVGGILTDIWHQEHKTSEALDDNKH